MSQSFDAAIENVVILSGATSTRWIEGVDSYSDATAICIQSPSALDAGTYMIEVSRDGSTAATLEDAGGDITVPAANKARQYTEIHGFKYFRIKGPTAAADRTFLVSKQWTA
jgi:hypothetical protein